MTQFYGVFSQFNKNEEEEKKKTASQKASETVNSSDHKYYGVFSTLGQEVAKPKETLKPVVATPTPQPAPEQKQNIFQKIGSKVKEIISTINPRKSFPGIEPTVNITKTPEYKTEVSQYMKFPNFFPNPDLSAPVESTSATMTPEAMASPTMKKIEAGQEAFLKYWEAPADNSIKAAQDLLTSHPKALEVMASAQKIIQDFEYKDPIYGRTIPVGINKNPLHYSIVKGVADIFLGSSQTVKETFETTLIKPVAPKGQEKVYAAYDTIGSLVGAIMSYYAGGAELKALKFGKATLPVLFATLGQTSATPDTTLTQRIEKLPVDVAAGWIFSKIPAFKPGGLSLSNIGKLAGGTGMVGSTGLAQGFLDAIIKGKSKEEALKLGAEQAVIMALFHIVGSGTGLLSDEILNSKIKTGKTTFTPEQFRNVVSNSKFADTPTGKSWIKIATEAETKGQNIEFNMEAFQKTFVSKKLNLDKPEGINIGIKLVDKAPQIGSQEVTPAEKPVVPAKIETLGTEITVFRGAKNQTIDTSMVNGITGGVSMSMDKAVAERFATKVGGTVKEYLVSPDAKVVNHSDLEGMTKSQIKKYIDDNQIDAIRFDVPAGAKGEAELRIVNDRVLKPVEVQAVGSEAGVPSKSNVATSLPSTRFQELATNLKASKPEDVSTILNVSPSQLTNRSFIQTYYNSVSKISQETLPTFEKYLEEATGIKPEVRVKKEESFIGKVERYLLNDKNPNEISDVLGSRVVTDQKNIGTVLENIKKNFNVLEVENFFEKPSNFGYQGINVKVKLPNGLPAEIQVQTPESLKIGKEIHPIYEKWRNKDMSKVTPEEKKEFLADMEKSKQISEKVSGKKTVSSKSKKIQTWSEMDTQREKILSEIGMDKIEPQVEEAVKRLNELGHPTTSSGFAGENSALAKANGNIPTHTIDGKLNLSDEQIKAINESGFGKVVKMENFVSGYQAILVTGNNDLDVVKNNFNKIVDIIEKPQISAQTPPPSPTKGVSPTQAQKATPPPKNKPIKAGDEVKVIKVIVPKNPSIPILTQVAVKEGKMMATDLETMVVLPTKQADGMYQVIGNDIVKSDFVLADYPEIKIPENKVAQILPENLSIVLNKAKFAISTDETRPVLEGINLRFGKTHIEVAATDGFRLFYERVGAKIQIEDTKGFTIAGIPKVSSLSKSLDRIVQINEGKDSVSLGNDSMNIVARKVDAEFPEYKKIYPAFKKQITFNKKELADAIKQIAPYAKDSANITKFRSVGDNQFEISATNSETNGAVTKKVLIKASVKKIDLPAGVAEGTLIMPIKQGEEFYQVPEIYQIRSEGEYGKEKYKVLDSRTNKFLTEIYDTNSSAWEKANGLNVELDKTSVKKPIKKYDFTLNYKFVGDYIKTNSGTEVVMRFADSQKPIHFADEEKPILEQAESAKPPKLSKEELKVKKWIKSGSAGSHASMDKFADLKHTADNINYFKAVEFPELLRMFKDITGDFPTVKFPRTRPSMGGVPYGVFIPSQKGKIILNPEIFATPEQAVKTFAHEIGHLTDYMPEGMMKRGNLLGRLLTLNKNMKQSFGDLKNADVKEELKALTQLWKPFDESSASEGFIKYRYSPAELYADAISVLFNDPQLLQSKAPIFWQKFFEYLDRKPLADENFRATWDLLNKGDEAIFNERNKAMDESFENAEDKFYMKELEKRKQSTNFLYQIQILLDNKNQAIINKTKQARKEGVPIADAKNPMFEMQGLNYLDGVLKNYVADNFQPIFEKTQAIDNGWETLGKVLQLERVIYERGEMANPGGYNPETAQKQLDQLKAHTDAKDWVIIEEAKAKFREAVQQSVNEIEKAEFYTPELITEMKANPAYATFQVVDYLDTYVSARVYKSIGTLKEVANPATSTVMKLISIKKAIERNKVKVDMKDLLTTGFPKEIEKARTAFAGKRREFLEPKDPDKGLLVTIEHGKPEGYYIDKEIARSFGYMSNDVFNMAVKATRLVSQSKFYRPLFTTINLGFQTFNFMRDFQRYWKNVPDYTFGQALTSFPRAVVRYAQALPHAYRRAKGLPDEMVKAMENSKMLGISFNDVFKEPIDAEDKQIERILQKAGILEKTNRRKILTPIYWVLDSITGFGDLIESLPKLAGYIELKDKMPENQLAQFIRTQLGSPDFRVSGYATPITNNIFLFSNAIKEGMKSDFQLATGKSEGGKRSQSGFWWKNVVTTILPKLMMVAAGLGLFGKWMKDRMDDASEYDKANYTIIPLGVDADGKTAYLRIPNDESGRLIGGLTWKIANMSIGKGFKVADLMDLFAFGAGQFPNLAPSFTGIGATVDYLTGRNPYDSFRGRNVIPDTEFNAGVKYSLPIFAKWLAQNQGLGIFVPSYVADNPTKLQKILGLPFLSNILGRWVKVSDYGRTEQNREITNVSKTEQAGVSLERRKLVDKYIKDYQKSGGIMNKLQMQRQLVKEVLGHYPPKNASEKTTATNTEKKFQIGILKGESDANMNSLIDAVSNDQKTDLLKNLRKTLSPEDFNYLTKTAMKYKVISSDVLTASKK